MAAFPWIYSGKSANTFLIYLIIDIFTNACAIFGKDQPGFTVRGNYKNYTENQVKRAILARKSQAMLAHLPDDKFKLMVSQGNPRNCGVTPADISNANAIFGPYLPGLRGRTVREKPKRVEL